MMSATASPRQAASVAGLTDALDTAVMTRRLAPWVDGEDGWRIVKAELLSLSPGKRAVVAYWTGDGDGRGPTLIGKLYADASRGARVHDLLMALRALTAGDATWAVPRPVALLSAPTISVQEVVRGQTIDHLDPRDRADGVIAAARWLAILHGLDCDLPRHVNLDSERRKMGRWTALIAQLRPSARRAADRLNAELLSRCHRLEVNENVPIHKDYHYHHVYVDGTTATAIDLDEVRRGPRAMDVAHFLANLFLLGVRDPTWTDDVRRHRALFVTSYATGGVYASDGQQDFYYSYTCLKIAKQLVGGRGPAPIPAGEELARQVHEVLDEGLRCLTS